MESRQSDEWHKAMEVEMKAMRENKVLSLTDSKNVDGNSEIDSRWVYLVKIKNNRKIYRARLVARRYLLEDDVKKVFAPMTKHATLRTLICITNKFDMKVENFDIITAFLYSKIEEEKDI